MRKSIQLIPSDRDLAIQSFQQMVRDEVMVELENELLECAELLRIGRSLAALLIPLDASNFAKSSQRIFQICE